MARKKKIDVCSMTREEYLSFRTELQKNLDSKYGDMCRVKLATSFIGLPAGSRGVQYHEMVCGYAVRTIVFENGHKTTMNLDIDPHLEHESPIDEHDLLEFLRSTPVFSSKKRNERE